MSNISAQDQHFVTLNNGLTMPAIGGSFFYQIIVFLLSFATSIGLGCYCGSTQEERNRGVSWIAEALKIGYRHLDTAYQYETEDIVGKAIYASGIPREQIFVTTKLP